MTSKRFYNHPSIENRSLLRFSQLRDLQGSTHPSIVLLRDVIREFRDDELEHLDTAIEHNSQSAPAHAFLSSVVGLGCKVAIELCKRV
jgi:ubiquinone biosynthesis monooxygenase Coq7